MNPAYNKPKKGMKKPERGPIPMARSMIDLNSDVDILQRRIGEVDDSSTTVEDLTRAGVVKKDADGGIVANSKPLGGPQGLYDFLTKVAQ
jgi:hypothetical protein